MITEGIPVGLREEKKRELRESILTTALALFGAQGLARTRIADVAGQLRISEATFFNYFPSKHAILDEAFARAVDAAVVRVRAAQPGDGGHELRRLGDELTGEFTADRPLGRLLGVLEAGSRPFAGEPGPELSAWFAGLHERAEIRTDLPPPYLAESFLDVVAGAVRRALAGRPEQGDQARVPDAIRRAVDLFVGGCAVQPGQSVIVST